MFYDYTYLIVCLFKLLSKKKLYVFIYLFKISFHVLNKSLYGNVEKSDSLNYQTN